MEIHVIRHTSVAVGKNICYGQSDVPLADTFSEEVESYRRKLPDDFQAIYCSPLKRCQDLAKALSFEDIITEKLLLEFNFGKWEGKEWSEIDQTALNTWMADFVNIAPPHGESFSQMYQRIQQFLDTLRTQAKDKVLLIAHSGVIRCIWAYLLEVPLKHVFRIPVGFGEHFVFKLSDNKERDYIRQVK